MVRWMTSALCAFAIACAEPTSPVSPTGTWRLVAIDGSPLPATMTPSVDAVSGSLELRNDGTYQEITDASIGGSIVRLQMSGSWRASGDMVELLNRQAGLPFVGHWSASALEVQAERAMKYAR